MTQLFNKSGAIHQRYLANHDHTSLHARIVGRIHSPSRPRFACRNTQTITGFVMTVGVYLWGAETTRDAPPSPFLHVGHRFKTRVGRSRANGFGSRSTGWRSRCFLGRFCLALLGRYSFGQAFDITTLEKENSRVHFSQVYAFGQHEFGQETGGDNPFSVG